MAREEATLLIKIKDMGSSALKGVQSLMGRFVITAGDLVNAFKAISAQVIQFAKNAAQFEEVRRSFSNLAASQGQDAQKMLQNMRELSRGTISDLELMKQANQAMLLGLPVERFGDMLEIARSSAKSTGQSMEFMLQSIVTGLGRGSKLMLDNLGILIDVDKANREYAATLGKTASQLTDAERKQAFINEALNVGKANAEAAGVSQISLNDMWAIGSAKAENMAIAVGRQLMPGLEILTKRALEATDAISSFVSGGAVGEFFGALAAEIDSIALAFKSLGGQIGVGLAGAFEAAKAAMKGNFSEAKQILIDANEESSRIATEAAQKDIENRIQMREQLAQIDANAFAADEARLQQHLNKKRQQEEEAALEKQVRDMERALLQQELDIAMITANEEQKLALQAQFEDKKLAQATSNEEKLAQMRELHRQRELLKEKIANRQMEQLALSSQQRQVSIFQAGANLVSAIAGEQSKIAFLIQKAAAIAQNIVSTNVAATNALASIPYPANLAAASQIKLAGRINLAAILATSIKGLADGGIVPAQSGGSLFRIGEGGRDEAVIPLPDDFDPDRGFGGSVTINFNGPIMGDQAQAREFAMVIDRQLLELRRNNESVAFDTDVI